MITITQQSHSELHDSIRMCAQQIELDDLCASGKDIWYKWTNYIEQEINGLLDESNMLKVEGIDTYHFKSNYIDFNNLHEHAV